MFPLARRGRGYGCNRDTRSSDAHTSASERNVSTVSLATCIGLLLFALCYGYAFCLHACTLEAFVLYTIIGLGTTQGGPDVHEGPCSDFAARSVF